MNFEPLTGFPSSSFSMATRFLVLASKTSGVWVHTY
jgi:hypothetical protein